VNENFTLPEQDQQGRWPDCIMLMGEAEIILYSRRGHFQQLCYFSQVERAVTILTSLSTLLTIQSRSVGHGRGNIDRKCCGSRNISG
jgi:hypothetical protein